MRITLLADLHLTDQPASYHGLDTQANFSRAITRIRELDPDHLVVLGDVSAREPRREDLVYAHSRLQLAEVPYSIVAGNHDDARSVAEVCASEIQLVGERLYYRRDFGYERALFLDTSRGFVGRDQLDWIKLNVGGARDRLLVFMHHPPLVAGVPFMDNNHALQDSGDDLYNILFSGAVPVHVFCGHYHTARSIQVGIHSVHLCPSTAFQLDPGSEEFAVAHTLPALRHVELDGDVLRTWVDVLRPNAHSQA